MTILKRGTDKSGVAICLEDHFEVKVNEELDALKLNFIWLRDNCRCTDCYSQLLNQRHVNILNIPDNLKPKSWELTSSKLSIEWDDGHKSEYLLEWLMKNLDVEVYPEPVLWSGSLSEAVTIKKCDLKEKTKVTDFVRSLIVFGVGFVKEVEPTEAATEEVVTSLFPIQRTFFGDLWTLTNNFDHFDSAYSNTELGAHNDNTYFHDGAGLQVFHLLEHNGTGGETLLVDGFRAVKDVEKINPEFVECLRNVSVESMYIDPNRHLTQFSPILHYHQNNLIKQIRFNLLDRSPRVPMPSNNVGLFYKSLRCLASKITEPSGEWWLKLQPGTVAFINNWRVLHGRASFTGFRKICGSYVGMADLLSKARFLKLII